MENCGVMCNETPIKIYDTTLRDGSQRRNISLSVEDKLKILNILDNFGVAYIEGGWPGSNPKDCDFFRRAQDLNLRQARLCAFGSTRRAGIPVDEDGNLKALIKADTPVVTIVGKGSLFQVEKVIETSPEENLRMIQESVAFLKDKGKEVVFDAEHFFDGFAFDSGYALSALQAAQEGGADVLVLCDTNGGSLPTFVSKAVAAVKAELTVDLGIHAHNDAELAVANSLAAVEAGCVHIQGTINGYGERCGNANLISIIPNLLLKMGCTVEPPIAPEQLTSLSRQISEIANLIPDDSAPYVGSCAFAHKGGIHVAAVEKHPESYEHIAPECVGNGRNFLISELSGKGNIRVRAAELGLAVDGHEQAVLKKIKTLESQGFKFENAEGTFELLIRREVQGYRAPFDVHDIMVVSEVRKQESQTIEAIIKLTVGEKVEHTVSEGGGPVDALDGAMRKALLPTYPELANVRLVDYKVRILDPGEATAATTRVTIEAVAGESRWVTVGCSTNIIEASLAALADSYELFLARNQEQR